jgi:hypothetical protein
VRRRGEARAAEAQGRNTRKQSTSILFSGPEEAGVGGVRFTRQAVAYTLFVYMPPPVLGCGVVLSCRVRFTMGFSRF